MNSESQLRKSENYFKNIYIHIYYIYNLQLEYQNSILTYVRPWTFGGKKPTNMQMD